MERSRRGPQWHADLGILSSDRQEELKRTRSDAVSAGTPGPHGKGRTEGFTIRARSQSGDSATLSKLHKVDPECDGGGLGDGGDAKNGNVGGNGESATAKAGKYVQANGHMDVDTHRTLKGAESHSLRKSQSFEDILLCRDNPDHQITPEDAEFCMLSYTEPNEVDTGGTYTMIFEECEYLSDEEAEDHSTEVSDLTPMDPSQVVGEGKDSSRLTGTSVTPPRASTILINAFLQRLESVMVNEVHYPPGLFFVQ